MRRFLFGPRLLGCDGYAAKVHANPEPEPELPAAGRPKPFHNPFDASWQERVLVLGTVFGTISALIVVGLLFWPAHTNQLLVLVPSSFFVLGKFLPLTAVTGQTDLNAYELGLVIGIMDTCTVLVIVYSLEALYKLGPIGRFFERVNRNAQLVVEAYPKIRRWQITGIVLFVLFPVSGTGAIGGSFLGFLLGMHRFRLIAAVSFGGFLGGLAMAFAAIHFGTAVQDLKDAPHLIGLVVFALVAALWGLNRAYKRALARARSESLQQGLSDSGYLRQLTDRRKNAKE